MRTYPTLLSAFRHPAVIFSILLLLLNDHVLKAVCPSELTGKLSDFAGLFFFPFLVGVAIQVGMEWMGGQVKRPARAALLIGLGLTGLVFAAVKTLPGVNGWAVAGLSRVLGLPVQIVPDPSDLIALASFAPAWQLWQWIERNRPAPGRGRWTYLALGLGVLASLASSPAYPHSTPSIERLVATWDGGLYAGQTIRSWQDLPPVYLSLDGVKSWTLPAEIPPDVVDVFAQPLQLPVAGCDPDHLLLCYRIDGQPRVEESRDGGRTWRTAWELGPRESYFRRATGKSCVVDCPDGPILATYDMAFTPGAEQSTLVVALGPQGLLTYAPRAGWQRIGLGNMVGGGYLADPNPIPLAARDLGEVFRNTFPEWGLALGLSVLVYVGFSLWAWIFAAEHPGPQYTRSVGWMGKPLWWLATWLGLLSLPWGLDRWGPFAGGNGVGTIAYAILLLAFPVLVVTVIAVVWYRAGQVTGRPSDFGRLGWIALQAAGGTAVLPTFLFGLWAAGGIVHYQTANLLAIVLSLGWLVYCGMRSRKIMVSP